MVIRRKHLGRFALIVAALFIVAAPLGDNAPLGKRSAVLATIGQGIWITFIISAGLLIIATIVALAQTMRSSRATN